MNSETQTFFSRARQLTAALGVLVLMAACASTGGVDNAPGSRDASEFVDAPDATPRDEPIVAVSTRPYTVFGKRYFPLKQRQPMQQTGDASWYGQQFHGRPTSIGETYDMYAMTAAHPTLPLPSFVRVTNLNNQRSVVVRVNDRGPFLNNRIIDLSFAAAAKIGFTDQGSAPVVMEVVDPVVVTLQRLRKRIGLSPNASPAQLKAATRRDEVALPLTAAARLPVEPAAATEASGPAPVANAGESTQAVPIPVNSVEAAAAATGSAAGSAPGSAVGSVLPRVLLPNPGSSVQDEPALTAERRTRGGSGEITEAKPQIVQSLTLSQRQSRRVADVFIPPDSGSRRSAPRPAGPPPVIVVESLEGNGLRRAVPEKVESSARLADNAAKLAAARQQNAPVFVVPFKDRLPDASPGPEAPARVYLQLGAYDTEKSAKVALIESGITLRWLSQPVGIIEDRGLHKLQAGPFASAKQAQQAARRIRAASTFSPFYVFR
ncbi:MAG: septal ring lytic transglycosylase RlpA family protein [Burkholderiaceae bacterium]